MFVAQQGVAMTIIPKEYQPNTVLYTKNILLVSNYVKRKYSGQTLQKLAIQNFKRSFISKLIVANITKPLLLCYKTILPQKYTNRY